MTLKQVKHSEIVKVALLLSVLVSLPKTIYVYHMIGEGSLAFSSIWIVDFLYRFVFFFMFSWSILQLDANVAHTRYNWSPAVRRIVMITVNIAVLILTLLLFNYLYSLLIDSGRGIEEQGVLTFTYSILLIVLFFIASILRLQTDQQESRIEVEHLKQQSLQNELMALKNQIDPHFLFNSLNTLSSLIRENEKATLFVNKLSYMYRYILQSGESDLVSVREELKFLESYTYLIRTRYRDRFSIDIHIEESLLEERIPPLALQLLMENAVKHNEISQTNPLKVRIFSKDGAIYVENPIRPRTTFAEGTKNGLLNLKKRFSLLRKQEIEVRQDGELFSVKLPIK